MKNHKNIRFLTKFGHKKCPNCHNKLYYDKVDSLNCDKCYITINQDSTTIDKEEFGSFDNFKYHYEISRCINDTYEISSFVNYQTEKTRVIITENSHIQIDMCFASGKMTLPQIYNCAQKIYRRFKKMEVFS